MIGNNKQHGFTLIEVLVATAILSIVMVVAVSVMVTFFGGQQSSQRQLELEDVQVAVHQAITDSMRQGRVDYDFYGGTIDSSESGYVAVREHDGSQTVILLQENSGMNVYVCRVNTANDTCAQTADAEADADWERLNPADMTLSTATFTVAPIKQPYFVTPGAVPDATLAPVVTMTTQLQDEATGETGGLMQTSVTSRFYAN